MIRRSPWLAFLALLVCCVSGRSSAFEPSGAETQVRWGSRTIQIAVSTSLTQPSTSIAPGSDVPGALQRALDSWSKAAGIKFVLVSSSAHSISPGESGDGISLITVAPTLENVAIFGAQNEVARTRIFFDRETGEISEADIVINPYPYSAEGALLQFSTDGTAGTYDLESTFAHELGHLLGLEHSSVLGATMHAQQGLNGVYGMPATSERSLSDADRVAVRSLYGGCEDFGSIKGRILIGRKGKLSSAGSSHVWIEELTSGRVVASVQSGPSGRFSMACVPAGEYRIMLEYPGGSGFDSTFTSFRDSQLNKGQRVSGSREMVSYLPVTAGETTPLTYILTVPENARNGLQPRLLGTNGDLSTVPVPALQGSVVTLHVAGLGLNMLTELRASSPYIIVDPTSLKLQQSYNSTPVISFDVTFAANVPPGDYSLRLESNSGELAYLVGAITISP